MKEAKQNPLSVFQPNCSTLSSLNKRSISVPLNFFFLIEYGKYLQYKKRCKKIGLKDNSKNFYSFCHLASVKEIKNNYEFLKEADSLALCAEYNNVKNAFENFFLGIRKFPKYKTRKD